MIILNNHYLLIDVKCDLLRRVINQRCVHLFYILNGENFSRLLFATSIHELICNDNMLKKYIFKSAVLSNWVILFSSLALILKRTECFYQGDACFIDNTEKYRDYTKYLLLQSKLVSLLCSLKSSKSHILEQTVVNCSTWSLSCAKNYSF